MRTRVLITIDTELCWRHHAAGLPLADIFARSIEPAGVGIGYQLGKLAEHRLKACFFVDPMPAAVYGLDFVSRIVGAVLEAGQEVQLHVHPNWLDAATDGGRTHGTFELTALDLASQTGMIARARDLLVAAGAPDPIAFRAGSYAANDDTLRALAALGIRYDSSHNGAEHPWPSSIALPRDQIAPLYREGVVEVPVSLVEDSPGRFRTAQLCAVSLRELRAMLIHALAAGQPAVTIVGHSFELATRSGLAVNGVHRHRFDALCRYLDSARALLPTAFFSDLDPLVLDHPARPLPPAFLRRTHRRVEQLWSNMVVERRA